MSHQKHLARNMLLSVIWHLSRALAMCTEDTVCIFQEVVFHSPGVTLVEYELVCAVLPVDNGWESRAVQGSHLLRNKAGLLLTGWPQFPCTLWWRLEGVKDRSMPHKPPSPAYHLTQERAKSNNALLAWYQESSRILSLGLKGNLPGLTPPLDHSIKDNVSSKLVNYQC